MLWYWGLQVRNASSTGANAPTALSNNLAITKITMPIAFLMWMNGVALLLGLPEYFRQPPLRIPSFYRSIARRKTIIVSRLIECYIQRLVTVTNISITVVFGDGGNTKLFPGIALQQELEISLVQRTRPNLGSSSSRHRTVHGSVGRVACPLRSFIHVASMDRPHVRRGRGRSAMGPDPLEHLKHGFLDSMGW